MTAKAMTLDAIQKLPDESTFDEIRERIEFIAGVRKGLEQIERGEAENNSRRVFANLNACRELDWINQSSLWQLFSEVDGHA